MKHLQKRIVILFVVFACLSAVVSAAGSDFATYENQNYKLSFQYPTNWKVAEGFMGTVVVFLSPLENADDKFSENVNLVTEDLTAYPGMTLEKYMEINLAQLPSFVTDYKLVARENSLVSGTSATALIYTGRQGIFQLKFLQVFIVADNRAYVLTFTAEEAQYKKYEAVARGIINSFMMK